jgi:hypothetical protein
MEDHITIHIIHKYSFTNSIDEREKLIAFSIESKYWNINLDGGCDF